ncbi:MAG: hypothetical protein M1491_05600, partial [Deltaproteobacteria bacterium]|nr:hypothetical protein [Deltaproteobacteria bacterium]
MNADLGYSSQSNNYTGSLGLSDYITGKSTQLYYIDSYNGITYTTYLGSVGIIEKGGNVVSVNIGVNNTRTTYNYTDAFPGGGFVFTTATGGVGYTDTDGIISYLGAGGKITAQTDGTDAFKYYFYDSYNRITETTDSVGRKILYGYSNSTTTLPTTVIDPDGNIYSLLYDSMQHLLSIRYPDGTSYTMSYGYRNLLSSITNPNGQIASYTYNWDGTLSSYLGYGGFYSFTVTSLGSGGVGKNAIQNSLGNSTQYWWLSWSNLFFTLSEPILYQSGPGACPSCGGTGGEYAGYGWRGNKLTQTDFNGNLTVWSGYDQYRDYAEKSTAYNTYYSTTTYYTWNHALHQPTSITTSSIQWPSYNKGTYYTYDSANELLSITETGYTFNQSASIVPYAYTTYYCYDSSGNMTGVMDADGNITLYGRDSMGNISSITNALNQTTYYSSYDNMGRVGTITDPNGHEFDMTYNWRGQVTSITEKGASSTGMDLTVYLAYDAMGNLLKVTYPLGDYLVYTYDPGNDVTSITRYNATGVPFGKIVYVYDTEGNKLSQKVYGPQNNLVRYTNYVYDRYNRLAQVINGSSSTTTYGYDGDGNMVVQTDPDGGITGYQYNSINKVSEVIQHLSTPYYGASTALTTYMYNMYGGLDYMRDANSNFLGWWGLGNFTVYSDDDMGRLVEMDGPDTGVTHYWYDPNGNILGKVNADGRTLFYTYDA